MELRFVINPAAGKVGRPEVLRAQIDRVMEDDGRPYAVYITTAPGDGERYVRETLENAAPGDAFLIVACGGDGTLHEAVNGAAGYENAAVAHYPCGSGNDYIRTYPAHLPYFSDLQALLRGSARTVDMICCNGRYCVNIASAGLDARIAENVQRIKRLPLVSGTMAYRISTVVNLFRRLSAHYRVSVDGALHSGRYIIAVAANGTHYGGGFNPIPEALPDDGVLEFMLVRHLSRFVIARVIGRYKNGRYREVHQYFERMSGREMILESDAPFAMNVDGEVTMETRAAFALAEIPLRFWLPALPAAAK